MLEVNRITFISSYGWRSLLLGRSTLMLFVALLLPLGSVAALLPGGACPSRNVVGALGFCGLLALVVVGLPRSARTG